MSRKGVGIGAFDRSRLTTAHYASHGSSLRATNAQALEAQLAVFRSLLQQFAATHARDIRSDPAFRAQFARMCTAIGVDPLGGGSGGGSGPAGGSVWAQLLGKTVHDFYFGLATGRGEWEFWSPTFMVDALALEGEEEKPAPAAIS
ncbi:hypothetical protein E4U53_005236 [Claviceps sorghi]|nr:hypothetical protein E4U53_005236 [Claviceps sorghi]